MRHDALRERQRVVIHGEPLHDDIGTVVDTEESDARIGDQDFAAVAIDQHIGRACDKIERNVLRSASHW